jgi:hypothetical protein
MPRPPTSFSPCKWLRPSRPPSSQQLKVGASVRAVANLVLVQGPLAPDPQKAIRWGPSAMLQRESGSETERRWWA